MVLLVRFAVVIQEDGLDKEWARDELTKMGAKVVDETDGTVNTDTQEGIPVWVYVCEGTLATELTVKLKWNCHFDNHYLYPMETRSPFIGEA